MYFQDFADVSFCASINIKHLCEKLNFFVGLCVCYDTFKIKNTEWLWLASDIVATVIKYSVVRLDYIPAMLLES